MTYVLAAGLATAAGPLYPLVAPYIGLLGAFMTGSNTNSNVVFAPLQQQAAQTAGDQRPDCPGSPDDGRVFGFHAGPRQAHRRLQHGRAGRPGGQRTEKDPLARPDHRRRGWGTGPGGRLPGLVQHPAVAKRGGIMRNRIRSRSHPRRPARWPSSSRASTGGLRPPTSKRCSKRSAAWVSCSSTPSASWPAATIWSCSAASAYTIRPIWMPCSTPTADCSNNGPTPPASSPSRIIHTLRPPSRHGATAPYPPHAAAVLGDDARGHPGGRAR